MHHATMRAMRKRRHHSIEGAFAKVLSAGLAVALGVGFLNLLGHGYDDAVGAVSHIGAKNTSGVPAGTLAVQVEPGAGFSGLDSLVFDAKHSIDMTMYELSDMAFEQDLAAAASRGVDVRVILDGGYAKFENERAYAYLAANRVQVRWSPRYFDVTHEKAIVVDSSTAVISTGNLTSRYYATTRDFLVYDRNPLDVAAIAATFNADFASERTYKAAPGSDLLWSPGSEPALVSLIGSAHTSLLVENEEMDNAGIEQALEAAARRGVSVEVTMTDTSDWGSAFRALEAAGVKVRTYPDTSSALYIHAKVVVADGRRAFVGSENFSTASLSYNRELGLLTSNAAVVTPAAATLRSDFARATPWR